MFGKFNSIKLLKTLIKFSAVALTSPATVEVASSLYPDHAITRIIVSAAALVLVEGCLLLGWEMLDQHGKNVTTAQRWLYAGLAWVAYISLFGIALFHNEGIAGLAFRLTVGVVLLYASMEAGLLASVKIQKQADKDILKDWRVKRYARRLSRRNAMADLDLTVKMRQLDRESEEQLYTLKRQHETQRQVETIDGGTSIDALEAVAIAKTDVATLKKANRKRQVSKQQAMERALQVLSENPAASPTEIGAKIGRSRQTVYGYLKELETEGRIRRNGTDISALT